MFKNAKVVMLPTNEKATKQSILLQFNKLIQFETDKDCLIWNDKHFGDCNITNQHLYIISHDIYKENEWCLDIETNKIFQYKYNARSLSATKKIIATTDKSLAMIVPDPIIGKAPTYFPKPSDSFIKKYMEEYNKGNIITNIMVEYDTLAYADNLVPDIEYIPKINPKDNTITIKKVKDSWTREEVISILKSFYVEFAKYPVQNINLRDNWIYERFHQYDILD